MNRRLIYSAAAQRHLQQIERYIARKSASGTAEGYIKRLKQRCDLLAQAPFQGTRQDHVRSGLRTTGFENRITIAFRVGEDFVVILAISYAGRRYEANL